MELKYCEDCGIVYYGETTCTNYDCTMYGRELLPIPKEQHADDNQNETDAANLKERLDSIEDGFNS